MLALGIVQYVLTVDFVDCTSTVPYVLTVDIASLVVCRVSCHATRPPWLMAFRARRGRKLNFALMPSARVRTAAGRIVHDDDS